MGLAVVVGEIVVVSCAGLVVVSGAFVVVDGDSKLKQIQIKNKY